MKKAIIVGGLPQLLLALGVGLAGAAPASAGAITWTLQDVTFNYGSSSGTITGSFQYDADSGDYSNVNLVTSAGTTSTGASFPGADYEFAVADSSAPFGLSATVTDSGTQTLILFFASDLTDAGGTIEIHDKYVPSGPAVYEESCYEYGCGTGSSVIRAGLSGGSVTSESESPSAPEPTPALLLAAGLAMLGAGRRFLPMR